MPKYSLAPYRVGQPPARPTTASRSARPAALLAIILVALSLRPGIASVGPALPYIIDQFGLSQTMASLLAAIPPLLMGLLAFPSPWLARTFGLDRTLLLALTLCGVSVAARGFATSTPLLILSTIGVGGGIAIAGALIGGVIKFVVTENIGRVMGIYAAALSFGAAVSAVATEILAEQTGNWHFAIGVWSLTSFVAVVAWNYSGVTAHDTGNAGVEEFEGPLRDYRAWLIAMYFASTGVLFYALLAWLAPMYREFGLSASRSASLVAVFSAAFMAGNQLLGWLSSTRDRRVWIFASALLVVVGLAALTTAPTYAPFLFVAICATGLGGAFTLGMVVVLDNTSSVEEANVWNAFVMGVGYSLSAVGPIVFGYSHDVFGNYRVAMWCLVAIAGITLPLSYFLKPRA